jgi:hypothetical protein
MKKVLFVITTSVISMITYSFTKESTSTKCNTSQNGECCNTESVSDCEWGSPSLRNCDLRSWNGTSYTIYPICPKCGKEKSSGQSGGVRAPHIKGDKETIKTKSTCYEKSCIPSGSYNYEYEYGFTVTAICK